MGSSRVAEGLHLLSLSVERTPLAGAHMRAGQYVWLSLPQYSEAPFALVNAPGARVDRYELLVRSGSLLSDALLGLHPGAPVTVGTPEGPGFPLERARGRPLVLAGTGSGVSPLISVLRTLVRERREYGHVMLLYGARTPAEFAFGPELDALMEKKIDVVRTVSAPDSGWSGLTGYVQHHIGQELRHGAVAFLCGQPEMVAAMTETLVERGVKREDVFLNV